MGRDLLNRAPAPIVHDDTKAGKAKKTKGERNKIGVQKRRELGQIGQSVRAQITKGTAESGKAAHKHQYFNNDISGVRQTNFGKSGLKTLRGSEEATNLRKIVIPGAVGVDHPEPAVLQGAMDLMMGEEGFGGSMEGFLGRQGAWAQGKGQTVEKLEERMRQLEEMVALRKMALARMKGGTADSVTLSQAASQEGDGLAVEDVATAGTELINRTARQGDGMHARLSKMFGVKMQ